MRRRAVTLLSSAALLLVAVPAGAAGGPAPTLDVGDLVVTEPSGRSGTASVAVPVVLSGPPAAPVTLGWRTLAGSAGTADFVEDAGTVTIATGSLGGVLPLGIRADRLVEATEHFAVEITTVTGATLGDGTGRVDIRDAATGLAVADVTVMEPDAGAADVAITVTVPSAPSKPVTFAWQLRSGSATVGSDVVNATGTGTIPKGALSASLSVRVLGDITVEGTEAFEVVVDQVRNVALADGIGRVTLVERDVLPPTPSPTPKPTLTPVPTPTPTPTPVPTPTPTPVPTPTPPAPDPLGGWQPPADSVPSTGTVTYLESGTGDYIGQGGRFAYTLADAVVAVDPAGDRFSVHVRGDERWDGWFAPNAPGTPIGAGAWTGLRRYGIFVPGLSWTGEGRGCNESTGSLVIDEWTGSTTDPARIVARFEQRCDASSGVLRGFVRYERDDPTVPPAPGDPATFPWSPPAGAVPATGDALYLESSPGDWVGQGRTQLYVPPTAASTLTESSGVVRLRVTEGSSTWSIDLTGPDAQTQLQPGLYQGLARIFSHNPVEGGLSVSGEGRGCNRVAGAVAVDAVTYDAEGLAAVTARFVQHCEKTGPPLYGLLRWSRTGS